MKNKINGIVDIMDFTDLMEASGVFESAWDGRRDVQLEWYGTILDYDRMTAFLINHKDKITRADWLKLCDWYHGRTYCSFVSGLVACEIERTILGLRR